jgi:hypothetical protein
MIDAIGLGMSVAFVDLWLAALFAFGTISNVLHYFYAPPLRVIIVSQEFRNRDVSNECRRSRQASKRFQSHYVSLSRCGGDFWFRVSKSTSRRLDYSFPRATYSFNHGTKGVELQTTGLSSINVPRWV